MSSRPSLASAIRPTASSRRDRALAECVAGAHALQLGKTDEGLQRYALGISLAPHDADIAALHGVALRGAARLHDAQRELIRAIALDASRADSYTQLAQTYRMAGDKTQAAAAFLAAAMLGPTDVTAWRDAAEALRLAGRLVEGLETAQRAAALAPDDPSIANTTALLLHRSDRIDDALALCARARRHAPDDLHLALTHGLLLRTCGHWDLGWSLYERRLELPEMQQRPHQPMSPRWTGGSLAGKHVLVRAEQGLGDQLQFVRFATLLKAHGAACVTVQTAAPLVRLLKTARHIDHVLASDLHAPPHHVHVDLMSLPHLLRSGGDMHPELVPYLAAPGVAPDIAQTLTPKPANTLRIGIAWAGTPYYADDASRSMRLSHLVPVLSRDDVQIVVLQQGPARVQLNDLDASLRATLIDAAPFCSDMGDTAHVMSRCDVLLCVDTSVGHVAGALGIPAWVMVAQPAEWRWGRQTTDSRFYPTVRVLRQARAGDWASVIRQVMSAIDQSLDGDAA
jgi:tetratricopeptide (TPR) repeat protein